MKHVTFKLSAFALAATALSGCAAIDTAQNAYSAVKTGYTAQAAYNDAKGIRDAQPLFSGFDSVTVYSQLAPRDEELAARIPEAFNDSLVYQLQQLAAAAGARLDVCPQDQPCTGRVLTVQFREEAYNASWAQKITMGSQLKGKLTFVEASTGRVVSEKAIEGAATYAEVLGLIRTNLMTSMAKSYDVQVSEAMTKVPAIKPGYEKILGAS